MKNEFQKTGSTAVSKIDDVPSALAEAGVDYDSEMARQDDVIPTPPRIRIEHSKSGNHTMYLVTDSYDDEGESEEIKGGTFVAQVVDYQMIRALFENDGDLLPTCAGIDGRPTISDPKSPSCAICQFNEMGSDCKPKVRLFLLAAFDGVDVRDTQSLDLTPCIFPLSPTSIKHWRKHMKRMMNTGSYVINGRVRQGTPLVAFPHTFKMIDVNKPPYRWAEVEIGIEKPANSPAMIRRLVELRKQLTGHLDDVSGVDFSDPGDKPGVEAKPAETAETVASLHDLPTEYEYIKERLNKLSSPNNNDLPF